ncbi:MAG: VTT domain-containing protein [Candidatus Diapherotrites archaeon]|nr:VTT domain-containing protein [Candidatus Diapherotrites archaeon]
MFFSSEYGLAGIFLASVISNATVLFPLPVDILVLVAAAASGRPLFSLLVALVSGSGAAIGELSSYFLGRVGISAMEKVGQKEYAVLEGIKNKIRDRGMVFIFLGAFLPFPFDLVGLACGVLKYDVKKFFVAALLGKVLRYSFIAMAGYFGIELIREFFLH